MSSPQLTLRGEYETVKPLGLGKLVLGAWAGPSGDWITGAFELKLKVTHTISIHVNFFLELFLRKMHSFFFLTFCFILYVEIKKIGCLEDMEKMWRLVKG